MIFRTVIWYSACDMCIICPILCSVFPDRNIAGLTSPIYGDKDNYVYVAAIDFGTTHSGYAFSPKSAPSDIYLNKDWGSKFDPLSYKCPTTILTNSEGKCVSFGFVAENDFCVETEGATANGFDLFRHFKMMLHKDKVGTLEMVGTLLFYFGIVEDPFFGIHLLTNKTTKNNLKDISLYFRLTKRVQ